MNLSSLRHILDGFVSAEGTPSDAFCGEVRLVIGSASYRIKAVCKHEIWDGVMNEREASKYVYTIEGQVDEGPETRTEDQPEA